MSIFSRLRTAVTVFRAPSAPTPVIPQAAPVPVQDSVNYGIVSLERNSLAGGYTNRTNPDQLVGQKGLKIYAQMRVDEQVKAAVIFVRDAILSRGWTFEFDKDSSLSETERAKRIRIYEQIVRKLPGSFIDSLNVISTGREFGFSLTEKVYAQIQVGGKTLIGLRNLLGRDPTTFMFYTDEYGELTRCEQWAAGKHVNIDLAKFIHYVHNPEFDRYFGRSDLREAHRSWLIKDTFMRYWAMGMEKFGGGALIGKLSAEAGIAFNSPAYQALQQTFHAFKSTASVLLPPGVDATIAFPQNMTGFKEAIEYHDLAIAKALLVPNLMGVSHTGQTGSYSQSQTQLEALAWRLKADADRLEACVNEQLFDDLGDLNWGDGEYPRFTFKPLSAEGLRWLIETWCKLVGAETVIPTEADEKRLREILEMPPRADTDKTLAETMQEIMPAPAQTPAGAQPSAADKGDAQMSYAEFGDLPGHPFHGNQYLDGYEQSALDRYKQNSYYVINDALRKGDASNPNTMKDVARLDSAISKSSLSEDTTLYRVLDGKRLGDKHLKVGAEIEDRGFMSTSTSAGKALNAVHDTGGGRSSTTTLEIRVPKGINALNMETRGAVKSLVAPMRDEGEYLLPRGTKLRIVSVDASARKAVAEVVSTRTAKMSRITHRVIRMAQERVDFSHIATRQETAADQLAKDIAVIVAQCTQSLLADKHLQDAMMDPKVLQNFQFSPTDVNRIKQRFIQGLSTAWALGRSTSQAELRRGGQPVAQVREAAHFANLRHNAQQFFEANGFRMASNVSDGARAVIQQELQNSVKFGRSPTQTREAVWARMAAKGFSSEEAIKSMVEGTDDADGIERALDELNLSSESEAAHYLDTLARTNLFESMNEARYAEYTDPALDGYVVALRYSAILDDRTTEICEALHDHVFKAENPVWDELRPPNHFNCRSVLIPVTQLDVQDGEWDGEESEVPNVEPQAGFK